MTLTADEATAPDSKWYDEARAALAARNPRRFLAEYMCEWVSEPVMPTEPSINKETLAITRQIFDVQFQPDAGILDVLLKNQDVIQAAMDTIMSSMGITAEAFRAPVEPPAPPEPTREPEPGYKQFARRKRRIFTLIARPDEASPESGYKRKRRIFPLMQD